MDAAIELLFDNLLLQEGLHPIPAEMAPRIQMMLERVRYAVRDPPGGSMRPPGAFSAWGRWCGLASGSPLHEQIPNVHKRAKRDGYRYVTTSASVVGSPWATAAARVSS